MKALIILFLCAAIFGCAAYFAYDIFVKPQKIMERETAHRVTSLPPDPGEEDFKAAHRLYRDGKLAEARSAFENFLENFPNSSRAREAKSELGEINVAVFLSPQPGPDKLDYAVRKGDVLMKIAAKMKSTPELIARANQLPGIMLRIGDRLVIPQPHFSVTINRKERTVTLLNGGKFFKEYRAQNWKVPATRATTPITTKIAEKIAWKDGKRVAFGTRDYEGSSRWITLATPGYTLFSPPAESSATATTPAGIELTQEEMEELSALLSRNVPVRIE